LEGIRLKKKKRYIGIRLNIIQPTHNNTNIFLMLYSFQSSILLYFQRNTSHS